MMDYDGWVVMENGLSERWVVEGERYLHYGGCSLVFGGEFPSGLCQIYRWCLRVQRDLNTGFCPLK